MAPQRLSRAAPTFSLLPRQAGALVPRDQEATEPDHDGVEQKADNRKMNDHGEQPNKGSLIEADYGKGRFVYTSLSFFRQLPAGVPGAYRLFINILSNPKKVPN